MAKETFYEILKVTKCSGVPEVEEVVLTTPHRAEALVVTDRLNADLSTEERLVQEFRFAQRTLVGGREWVT